jgi:hypothetical protein
LISACWVARITGMSHWCFFVFFLKENVGILHLVRKENHILRCQNPPWKLTPILCN